MSDEIGDQGVPYFDIRPFAKDPLEPERPSFDQSHAEAIDALRKTRAFFLVTLDEEDGLTDFRTQCTADASPYELWQLINAAVQYAHDVRERVEDEGAADNG